MNTVPYWEYWNPMSGLVGGVVFVFVMLCAATIFSVVFHAIGRLFSRDE